MNDRPTPPPYHEEDPTPFEEGKTGDYSGFDAAPMDLPASGETLPGDPDQEEAGLRPALLVIEGPNRGQRFALDKHVIAIGRTMSADIVVKDSKSSRHHARILYTNFDKPGQEPDCRVFDTGSTNGTFVNGKRVEARGVLLVNRDRIRTGKTVFGYFSNRARSDAEDSGISVQTHDESTGLFNLAIFERMLHREVERAKRYQRPLSVLLATVRGEIMEQRSASERGEACLRAVAPHVSGVLRAHDLCARVGQDRIGAVMPETDIDGAAVVAERICEIVEAQRFQCMEQEAKLHVSVGVAELEWDIDTPQKLLEHAASAMLDARGASESRTVRYDRRS